MQHITIKKGLRFQIAGRPTNELISLPDPAQVALLPVKIPHIKPRLRVSEGDDVQIGSILFEDKRNPAVKFLSPGGGKVRCIQVGPRRAIEAIVIDCDAQNEARIDFDAIGMEALDKMDCDQLKAAILKGGLWWVFRQLPFRDLPLVETTPPLIMVGLDTKEPFHASPAVYLQDRLELLAYGLKVLHKLSDGQVVVFADALETVVRNQCEDWLTHTVAGSYPADDPGTVLYHIKQSPSQNHAWFISGQDLLLLAQLLAQGRYPTERVVTVGGSSAPVRKHLRTRLGVPLAHLVDGAVLNAEVRYVLGGLLRGYESPAQGFMGLYETSLTLVPQGRQAEFLALFNPGLSKPTCSRTFLSRLNPGRLVYDCNLHGSRRACIACMHCADICPVDILPQMTYKAILSEEVELYLRHGLLDCVECGLCSYVCPSKIELSQTFKVAKAAYAKEQSG